MSVTLLAFLSQRRQSDSTYKSNFGYVVPQLQAGVESTGCASNAPGHPWHHNVAANRQWARDYFNLLELHLEDIFRHYDLDGSGFLEICEVEFLLRDLNGGRVPPTDETLWLMQIADKDRNSRLSKGELLAALQAWNGYLHMPAELKDLFTECDVNNNGYLDLKELQTFLSRIAGEQVSEREATEVMETADLLSDGRLGRYELLGAVGSWYISVGRQPTPPMSLAFVANNRSGSRWHQLVHYLTAATLLPTAYFPLVAYLGSQPACALDLPGVLLAEGMLWLVLAVVVAMKGHWLQLLNAFVSPARAARLVYRMSWCLVGLELFVCGVLLVLEAVGMAWVRVEETSGKDEMRACNRGARPPIDVPVSLLEARPKSYPSFLDFCRVWFTFNVEFNTAALVFYYVYIAYRIWKVQRSDQDLQSRQRPAGGARDENPLLRAASA